MSFWDASAVVPLCLATAPVELGALAAQETDASHWWATRVECVSAFAHRTREGQLTPPSLLKADRALETLLSAWTEIEPTDSIRDRAERLLRLHPLRAADALQLAAALDATDGAPGGWGFVSLDNRLRAAAAKEGFTILPATV